MSDSPSIGAHAGSGAQMRPYAVIDIDGVVADVRHRLHHVERRPKDWGAFFAAAPEDPLLEAGATVVRELADVCSIVWLTGRPSALRAATQAWLKAQGLPVGTLLMRRGRDFRPSAVAKLEHLQRLRQTGEVHIVVDDDQTVLAAAREAGFAVLRANWMDRPQALAEAQQRDGRT